MEKPIWNEPQVDNELLIAIAEYDELYLKDWVSLHQLSNTCHEELLNILIDSFYFLQNQLESQKSNGNMDMSPNVNHDGGF